jgi:hypothetical protein
MSHKDEINKRRRELRGRYKEVARRRHLRKQFGISLEDYNELLQLQAGCCAICKEPAKQTLAVDHNHETGKIRGLLCYRCNYGLGWFSEDPCRIGLAATYLISNEDQIEDLLEKLNANRANSVTISR